MCGLVCVFAKAGEAVPDEAAFRAMTGAIRHRGPDEEGIWIGPRMGMGHRRLSIIDLDGAHQPMKSADGAVVLVFNGEIYNFRELATELEARGRRVSGKSDTEVLLAGYLEWGAGCVQRLNGMFAFVIYDARTGTVLAARDRFGEKPLYYHEDSRRLAFASELKALLAGNLIPREVDPASLYQYFTRGYVSGDRSIFRGVRKLPAAHLLQGDAEGVRVSSYWSPPAPSAEITDPGEALERTRTLISDSIRLRMVSDVPLGFFLSGGIDSTLLVALGSEVSEERLETFSVGFDEAGYDERPYARQASRRFGTRHHELVLRPGAVGSLETLAWHLDEPFADSSALPTYFISKLTRNDVTVVLSGDGGDEMFAGYDVYKGHVLSERLRRLPGPALGLAGSVARGTARLRPGDARRWRRLAQNLEDAALPMDRRFLAKQEMCFRGEELLRISRIPLAEAAAAEVSAMAGHFARFASPLEAIAAWQRRVSLTDDMLVKVDRMSMAHSLEVRTPFLDHRIAELATRIPFPVKMPGLRTKYLLKTILEDYLPREFVWRPKQGFVVPLDYWFEGGAAGSAGKLLLDDGSMARRIFHRDALERVLGAGAGSGSRWGPALWSLVVFEHWCRRHDIRPEHLPAPANDGTPAAVSG